MSFDHRSLLANPHPRRHIVFPYNDEAKAINAVHLFASSGLSKGESVVLIMTDRHSGPVTGRLAAEGLDLEALKLAGRLECINAAEMLQALMPNGKLSKPIFDDTVGGLIGRARASSPVGRVRLFGAMVTLLLESNNFQATERLEEMWNEVIEKHSVSLLCTYTLLASGYEKLPDSLLKLHNHDMSSWTPEDNPSQRESSAND